MTIIDTYFTEGWWSNDKNGKNKITNAKLEDVVYFNVKTKNINGKEITLKLYERDKKMCFDNLSFDEDKFPDKKVIRKAIVKNNMATIKLELDVSWEKLITEDADIITSKGDEYIELYWEVTYNNDTQDLPKSDDKLLNVTFSERKLYINYPDENYKYPEMFTNEGNPLLIVNLAKQKIEDEITQKLKDTAKDAVFNITKKGVNKTINIVTENIAIAKLEKGFLVDNIGVIHSNKRKLYNKDIFRNGKLKTVKMGKNFGNKYTTTKGINQLKYFSKHGKSVSFLNGLKVTSKGFLKMSFDHVGDVLSATDMLMNGLDTSKPLSIPIPNPVIAIGVEVLGMIALEEHNEIEEIVNQRIKDKLELAKLKGIDAIEIFVYNYEDSIGYRLIDIKEQTLNKLLANEFKTIYELISFNSKQKYESDEESIQNKGAKLLYREIVNPNRNK